MNSPARRRAQLAANFREGQNAYNQFMRNLATIERNTKARVNLLTRVGRNSDMAEELWTKILRYQPGVSRLVTGVSATQAAAYRRNRQALMNRIQPTFNQNQALQQSVRNAKRRVIAMVAPRFRPAALNNWAINQWWPHRIRASLELTSGNKARRRGLQYALRPGGPGTKRRLENANAALRSKPRST